jgi:hypothetical protein
MAKIQPDIPPIATIHQISQYLILLTANYWPQASKKKVGEKVSEGGA